MVNFGSDQENIQISPDPGQHQSKEPLVPVGLKANRDLPRYLICPPAFARSYRNDPEGARPLSSEWRGFREE
jgi:hypothetical protein